jgi:hypothetical protein
VSLLRFKYSRLPSESKSEASFLVDIFILFIYYLVCKAIGTAVTPGLSCQPRVIVKMIVEKEMECRLTGET